MKWFREIFQDDRAQLSAGRIYAGYCVIAALACWVAGVWWHSLAAHAQTGMNAFLTTGVAFYGAGKASERFGKQGDA